MGRLGRSYRLLWLAAAVSNLGDGVVFAAAPLLAARITRDPAAVASLTAATSLPWVLFGLPGGVIVDRTDRRLMMGIVEGLRGLVIALLGVAVAFESVRLPVLVLALFVVGIGETIVDPAAQAMVPLVVDDVELNRANGGMYAAEVASNMLIGPPIGALLFAAAASTPFLFDAASFAASAALVLAVRGSFRARRGRRPDTRRERRRRRLRFEVVAGVRCLWDQRGLRWLTITAACANVLTGAILGVYVLFARERLGTSDVGYGLLLSAGAVGGVVGGVVAGRVVRRLGESVLLTVTLLVEGCADAVIASTHSVWVAGVLGAVGFFCAAMWAVVSSTLRQRLVPDELRGRAGSAYRVVSMAAAPLGAVGGGFVAKGFGLAAPYWGSGAVLVFLGILTALVLRQRMLDPGEGFPDAPEVVASAVGT